ncbi:DUF1345 domain-containing protein [Chitinophaga sp. SYP-B3965]|uniref:DUF1345 domain-containing protein n=1 Tax=Chitinophaga sp. SYP-B3965 TaxID=2663120 RepID=UPI0012998718|nr:DUF1345 domain-containing protein [Chitinophaga sp. SYP-B3965]MRG47986.1 DUF1345 domain-containing protein [Chitinophaga sp. SYP-B3965]
MADTIPQKRIARLLLEMHPTHKILASLALALLTFFLARNAELNSLVVYLLAWDVFALTYITLSWIIFFLRPPEQIRKVARVDDGSQLYVFLVILIAAFSSMFTVLLLMLSEDASGMAKGIYIPVAVGGMLLSWAMVHTTFTVHYAHLYYDDAVDDSTKHAEGLTFPKEKKPDYLDFAYFSFVIGMTFQVSDVQIESRIIRRLALVHGLLSFLLNTFVVALTINLIAGLKK